MLKALGKMIATIIGSIVGAIIALIVVLWGLSLIFVKATEKIPTKPVKTVSTLATK